MCDACSQRQASVAAMQVETDRCQAVVDRVYALNPTELQEEITLSRAHLLNLALTDAPLKADDLLRIDALFGRLALAVKVLHG